ncbi:unnamed protein product, partial [Parnassius mnemosyne]
MSRNRCCVPGCVESGNSHSVLHGFPNPENNPELFRSWIYAVGGDILGLDNQYIYKLRRVCHAHFEQKYCCRYHRISKIAVPTINLPGPLVIPKLTVAERRPLRAKENMLIGTPSSSKDPVYFASEAALTQSINQSKENVIAIVGENKVNAVKKLTKRVIATKSEKELHRKIRALKMKLSKCQNKAMKQSGELKSAKKLFTNPKFLKIMDNWTTSAKLLTLVQFREYKKKSKGRRFSTEEKILALTMMKQSPKAYRFLRKMFILPSPQILLKMLNRCTLRPGINKNIFSQLKIRAEKMKDEHKLCALVFDEMQLRASITYNRRKDAVSGFVTDGQEAKKILADHAQVFLIRGLIKNFKQPIAYTFSSGMTKGCELAKQIKEIITELQQVGFKVLATICDQGTNNRQAIKILKEETRRSYLCQNETEMPRDNIFIINSQEIVSIFDPPHLLKGIRNNLLTKNLNYKMDGKPGTAKWHHLELLYKENPGYKGIRLMPTLTETHIIPTKIPKMKVKYASQIFSRTISSNMGYLADKGILPEACKETADFLFFMDNLFDSVNGSYPKNKYVKPLLGPVTPTSIHKKIWTEGKKILQTLQFVNQKSLKTEFVPTVQSWITTINGMEDIVAKLEKDYKITSVWMRHLNQDPLENFFGAIRSHGCRNNNPTTEQFESAFATLLINNLTSVHAPGSNCENDNGESLYSLIINKDSEVNKTCEVDINDVLEIQLVPLASKSDPRIMAPLEYVSGYFIKKSKQKIWRGCKACHNNICNINEKDYIKHREFAGRNWLHSPNDLLLKTLSEMQDICNYM